MKVNTLVVRALMALRLIDDYALSHTVQLPVERLHAWLYDDDAEAVPYHRQLEVLALLGIDENVPRDDAVHHWTVVEPWFGETTRIYWALEVMTRAFGRAQAVFVAPEADPAFSFSATAHYGLRFDRFHALLKVRGPALRSIRFDPERIPGLAWVPGNFGLLLETERMAELQPGAMQVEQLARDVAMPLEMLKWEQLSKLASTSGLKPEELAKLIVSNNPQLGFSSTQAEEPADDAPGEADDALFTAGETEEEGPAAAGAESAEGTTVDADRAAAMVARAAGEAPVGPTGAPPRRRGPVVRLHHAK